MMYYYNDFFPFHIFDFVFMFLFWFLIVYGIVTLLRRTGPIHHRDDSLEILKARYAKGEINKEQFEEMKKNLR